MVTLSAISREIVDMPMGTEDDRTSPSELVLGIPVTGGPQAESSDNNWRAFKYSRKESGMVPTEGLSRTWWRGFEGDERPGISAQAFPPMHAEEMRPAQIPITDAVCSICYDRVAGTQTVRLPCQHVFHQTCLAAYNGILCPLCRTPFKGATQMQQTWKFNAALTAPQQLMSAPAMGDDALGTALIEKREQCVPVPGNGSPNRPTVGLSHWRPDRGNNGFHAPFNGNPMNGPLAITHVAVTENFPQKRPHSQLEELASEKSSAENGQDIKHNMSAVQDGDIDLSQWRSDRSSSGYRNVQALANGKFQAKIFSDKKHHCIGTYSSAEEAARAVAIAHTAMHRVRLTNASSMAANHAGGYAIAANPASPNQPKIVRGHAVPGERQVPIENGHNWQLKCAEMNQRLDAQDAIIRQQQAIIQQHHAFIQQQHAMPAAQYQRVEHLALALDRAQAAIHQLQQQQQQQQGQPRRMYPMYMQAEQDRGQEHDQEAGQERARAELAEPE